MSLSQKELATICIPILISNGKKYKKNQGIWARKAIEFEEIISITNSGIETKNIAKNGDYVVTNDTIVKEKYIVDNDIFHKTYEEHKCKKGYYLKKTYIYALKFNLENFKAILDRIEYIDNQYSIEAKWGKQVLNIGDYLVCDEFMSEIYRIDKIEFFQTYSEYRMDKITAINYARKLLRGGSISINSELLIEELKENESYNYLTELLLQKIENEKNEKTTTDLKHYIELARFIYKDTSLSSYVRFNKAIDVLVNHCQLDTTQSIEILGLAGAIFKNKWQFDGQFSNLFKSKNYYEKGYKKWLNLEHNRDPFCTINLAFLNYLIGHEILKNKIDNSDQLSDDIRYYLHTSSKIWTEVIEYLQQLSHIQDVEKIDFDEIKTYSLWDLATMSEACFGLERFDEAYHYGYYFNYFAKKSYKLRTFKNQMLLLYKLKLHIKEIELKSNIKQKEISTKDIELLTKEFEDFKVKSFEYIFNLFFPKNSFSDDTLELEEIKSNTNKSSVKNTDFDRFNKIKETLGVKKGIALSGGGFRASLYHIGVLAALAENNKLKDVEVISCVSGGSIIGAYYYIKLKQLLETKPDQLINAIDYINLISSIESSFLSKVQHNLRMNLFLNIKALGKMIFCGIFGSRPYPYSSYLAELYNKQFYNPLLNGEEVYIDELKINPKDDCEFNIKDQTLKRINKVPQLILNATTLNTGHNWQFTVTWMGEPPFAISKDFDTKARLRRMYYEEAPNGYQKIKLGQAVAASSCVPLLFEAQHLPNLYPNIELQLVDGGVSDNQGIVSILEQECNDIIVSDGSAQLVEIETKTNGRLMTFYRVDSILQERIREIQLIDLNNRNQTNSILDFKIAHLKKGLNQPSIDWVNCTDPPRKILTPIYTLANNLLSYNIMKKIQLGISKIRTDLDSFSDKEANAIMLSGYNQTIEIYNLPQVKTKNFNFLKIEPEVSNPKLSNKLEEILDVGKNVFFKIIKFKTHNQFLTGILIGLSLLTISYFVWIKNEFIHLCFSQNQFLLKSIEFILIIAFIGIVYFTVLYIIYPILKLIFRLILYIILFITSAVNYIIINKWYNHKGK